MDYLTVTHSEILNESQIGREAGVAHDDHLAVRLWLRLLSLTTQIEQEIRVRLRREFSTSLPRFDYLAQLDRFPAGLRMNALSRNLMVTGGNVTGLTDELVKDNLVERLVDEKDRRAFIVRLTPFGRQQFSLMASRHELWLKELLHGVDNQFQENLYNKLGCLRQHLARQDSSMTKEIMAKEMSGQGDRLWR